MKLVDLKVNEFTEKVASKSPAPGGGSVSALALSLGSSLTSMVGALSTGKKVFKAKEETIQQSFLSALESIRTSSLFFIDAIDKDTEAFNLIMAAFKMPKDNEKDIIQRSKAIQDATLKAIEVPFEVANEGVNVLKQLDIIVQHGNKNTISDIGVAVLMITAGIEGAILNVKINLSGLKNELLIEDYNNKVNEILKTINTLKNGLLEKVYQGL